MYKLPYFFEKDNEKVIAIMKENSFAIITGFSENYPVATHIPLEIEVTDNKKIFLKGHLMKNTDHHKAFLKNNNVLVVFNGPHCYVSASWYNTPAIASTWNYITVHAKGKITFTDEEGTYNAVKEITNKYEETISPASFDKLTEEYVRQQIKAIIGFTIEVESMDNVFKLSQNQDEQSKNNLLEEKDRNHAKEVKNKKKLI